MSIYNNNKTTAQDIIDNINNNNKESEYNTNNPQKTLYQKTAIAPIKILNDDYITPDIYQKHMIIDLINSIPIEKLKTIFKITAEPYYTGEESIRINVKINI
jgi:hypothetical protein